MSRKLTLVTTARSDGRVCKRIDGHLRIWPDADHARKEIMALIAIREGSIHAADVAAIPKCRPSSIRDVFNAFIIDREGKATEGRLKKGTFLDYKDALDSFVSGLESWRCDPPDIVMAMKRMAPVSAITPAVFNHIRSAQAKGIGSYMLDRRVQGVRTAFKWAFDVPRMIPVTPHYGDAYRKPTHADKRSDRRKQIEKHGERRFSAAEVAKLLDSPLIAGAIKPMVWLALNGGLYGADCASLRWGDIKQEGKAWLIDTYREKTQIRQRFVLWPETMRALKEWKAVRRTPKDLANADLVFITAHGNPFANETLKRDKNGKVIGGAHIDAVNGLFRPILETLKIKRVGLGFGAFRHTHISAAARCSDVNARLVVRGHMITTIESHYDFQDIDRLKAVTNTVYANLIRRNASNKLRPRGGLRRKLKSSLSQTESRPKRGGKHA